MMPEPWTTIMWLVGVIVSHRPIHKAILGSTVTYYRTKSDPPTRPGMLFQAAILATLASLFWFCAVPFFLSRLLYGQFRLDADGECETVIEEHDRKLEVRERMKQARREIEVESRVEDGWERDERLRGTRTW